MIKSTKSIHLFPFCIVMVHLSLTGLENVDAAMGHLVNKECVVNSNVDIIISNETSNCLMTDDPRDGNDEQVDECFTSAESSSSTISTPDTDLSVPLGQDMGEPQLVDHRYAEAIASKVEKDRQYMKEEVMVQDKYQKIRGICKNNHESCTLWALLGECDKNPGYMEVNCGPACRSCELLDIAHRCPLDPDAVDALYPGDVNKMFERIATHEEYKQFEPIVMSRPPHGPWLIVLENAISEEEAERLIELGGNRGYERSTDVGDPQPDGSYGKKVSTGRTSTNAWCMKECADDPIAKRVTARIENITGVPENNYENLQLLQYEEGQYYNAHSDYIPYQIDRPTGVRILTFYMYLNDVDEGGGTKFPDLNMTVTPRRGRAVLWPSVLDGKPNRKDSRTIHEAMPVIKGVKYGANAWIHQRDYRSNSEKGC